MASIFSKIGEVFKKRNSTPAAQETPQTQTASAGSSTSTTPAASAFKPNATMTVQKGSSGKKETVDVGFKPTSYKEFSPSTAKETEKYTFDRRSLSDRSRANDAANGIDWSGASREQLRFNDTYYKTLDDPAHTKMYRDLETASRYGKDATKEYRANRDALGDELDRIAKEKGRSSDEYRALQKFVDDYTELGRKMVSGYTKKASEKVSQQADDTIDSIFSGVQNRTDYQQKVAEGKKGLDSDLILRLRYNLDAASEKQRDMMYYVYATEGKEAAREFFDRFIGESINYQKAAKDFADDIANDSKLARFWQADVANAGAAFAGQIGTGLRQTFTDTKVDPNDRTILGNYSINDSIDDYLRQQVGDNIKDSTLKEYGTAGFAELQDKVDKDWIKDATQNASEYQKQFLGYLYLATGSKKEAREAWESLKQRGDAIWQTVNGKGTVATSAASMEGQMYRDYLGLGSKDTPSWLGRTGQDEELTVAQAVWDLAETTRAQYPQIAANIIGAGLTGNPMVGRVLGAAVMSIPAYGNEYKQAVEEGKNPKAAAGFAATQALMEFGSDYLLSGIAPIAGSLTNDLGLKFVKSISNPFLRALANSGVRALGEGAQEYIQEIATNPIRNLWFGEQNAFEPISEEAAYNFFLGAMSAFLMGPTNTMAETRLNTNFTKIGEALNGQNSTEKLVDTVLNNPVEGGTKEQQELYEEAAKLAKHLKDGSVKPTDVNVGEVFGKYAKAGGDTSFLDNPGTVAYNKDSITLEDMIAGANSMLHTLNGDVGLAESVAKLAMGQAITTEMQEAINKSTEAQQVLSQLQGDLDMSVDNALSRAARATIFKGSINKIYSTLKNSNPEKNVVSPAVQTLYDSGVKIKEAEKIGAVFNKVLDGQKVSEKEAKLVRASSPAIRAAALQILGLDLSEYAGADLVLTQLNELAGQQQTVKEQQADVKRSMKVVARARGAAMQGGFTNGQSGLRQADTGRPAGVPENGVGAGLQGQVPGAAPEGSGSNPTSGRAPASGNRSGQRSRAGAARNEDVRARVIPSEELDEGQKRLQEALVSRGFDVVEFVVGQDSCCGWDPARGVYVCQIRVNGQFGQNQYADHESLHLWLDALDPEAKKALLFKVISDIYGENTAKPFSFLYDLYNGKGYFLGKTELERTWQVFEDMLCFAYGGQNFQGIFDFSAYQEAVRSWVEENNLRAIGMGDTSNPAVQEAIKADRINKEYYDRHGYLQSDSTEIDVGTAPETTAQPETRAEEARTPTANEQAIRNADAEDLKRSVKNLRKERRRLIREAEQNGTRNTQVHRDVINALNEQIEEYQSRIDDLTQHSADYEEENYGEETVDRSRVQGPAAGSETPVRASERERNPVQKPKRNPARKSERLLKESKDLHEDEVKNLVEFEEAEIVPEDQVPEEYRWIKDALASVAPDSDVTYYRDYSEYAYYMFTVPSVVQGADGGFFVNLAKIETGDWEDDGWTLEIMVNHEKSHYWLDKGGHLADKAWRNLRNRLLPNANEYSRFAVVLKAYRDWCEDNFHDAEEELICDIHAGRSMAFDMKAPELWTKVKGIVDDFFANNTESNLVDENARKQYSADYDPEYFQSIGLINPDGTTASFTDNIGGVHEEILNQLHGTEGEDIKDFIARGGVRVKPGVGIEVNGDIEPTFEQYDVIDAVVDNFTGKTFSIDFNIKGTAAGTHTFEGFDIDPSRIYSYLRNYYQKRKASVLDRYATILGMPVKTLKDAYNVAKFQLQMEGDDPELQEIIDAYENRRYSADYDVDEEFDEQLARKARESNVFSNDLWEVSDENPEDDLQAEYDALFAELDAFSERKPEIMAKIEALQNKNMIRTANTDDITTEEQNAPQEDKYKEVVDSGAKTEKLKSPAAKAFQPKAKETVDLPTERNRIGARIAELEDIGNERKLTDAELSELKQLDRLFDEIQKKIQDEYDERKKTATKEAFKPKEAAPQPEPKVEEKKPLKVKPIPKAQPKPVDNGVTPDERSAYEQLKAELEANPELANDPAILARAAALVPKMAQQMTATAEKVAQLEAQEAEAQASEETATEDVKTVTRVEDTTTKFARKDKGGNWWKNIGRSDTIEIRRRRSDRNAFDVRITDAKGNTVVYDDVSPAMLTKAFGVKTNDRKQAMERTKRATALAQNVSLSWSKFDNPVVEKAPAKPKPNRSKDNLGRSVPARLSQYMDKSAIRTEDGALINTYRLAAENGVHNAKAPGRFSMFTERPASMNIQRGMTGAAAYGQSEKAAGEKLAAIFDKLADPTTSESEVKKLRSQIAQLEEKNKKYVSGITRLDPTRPGFQFAQRENVVNGKSVLETYLDIRKPKVIDAQGQGLDFVQREVRKFINDPANKAGIFDNNRDPVGPNDGFKFTNVNVVPEGQTLGGGERDLDTVYVTFRNNQAKSTYNTNPTTSDLLQYSADYDAKVFKDMEDRGIIEKGRRGHHDLDGNYISPVQAGFFDKAKSLDRNGVLVYGVIPLFHGGRSIYLVWDPDKAHDARAFFLATNPATSETYMAGSKQQLGPGEMVDLMKYEALLSELTDRLGLGPQPDQAIDKLVRDIKYGSPKEKAEAAKTYAEIYNATVGQEYGKITPVESDAVSQLEQILDVMLDDQYKLGDLLADLEDVMDSMTDSDTKQKLQEFDDLANDLYFAVDKLRTTDNLDWSSSYRAANLARQVAKAEPIISPETGEILNWRLQEQAKRITDQINTLDDFVMGNKEDVQFENEGMDGFWSTIDDLPIILPGTGVSAFYANTTNPLVVDGTVLDPVDRSEVPGEWDAIDVSRNPELLKAFPNGYAATDEIAKYALAHNYDSVIIHNIYDLAGRPNDGDGSGDIYIVFNSNQIKSVNNRFPTLDPRYNHSADYTDVDTGYEDGSLEDTLLKILWDKDEDRAAAALSEFFFQFVQTGNLPQMENERTRNIFQPRVTPGEAKVIDDQFKQFIKEFGALEKGANPARDVSFPKQTDTGYARRFFRTAAESKNTPEWTMDALKREFLLDSGTYQRMTDKAAIAYADRELARKGYDKVLAEWQGKIDAESKLTKNDVAIGETLLNEALNAGDMETAMRLIAELAEVGTTAGQTVQAFSMLKKMPKSYQLYYFQRVANRLNRQYAKRLKDGKQIKIDSEYAKAVLNAKTKEELDAAIDALIRSIADQVPVNIADKWNAWRYLSMLGNLKTHIRNVLGNAIFAPAKFAKDLVAAGLESTLIKDPNKRTTSFKGLLDRKGAAEYRKFAETDYEGIKQELQSGGKYNPTNAVMEARTIFKNNQLEKLRRLNGEWLEKEDGAFLKFHYVNALTNFLATKGVSLEELQGTREGKAILNAARQYAFLEAQKATYRDASAVAAALNQLKRAPGIGVLLEGLLPFAKTPINILKRGIEYSPIGLLDATTRQLAKLKNGDITANEFVDHLASGLTGTGIAILGFWLASQGLLRGGDDDDDKQADADKLIGYQNYSINLGNTNYTIDWMAPSALPLFVGAAVFNELREKNGLSGADFYNALTVIAEPITQLSMLSGLNDTLKSAKWDDNPFASVIQSMGAGYISQGLPTLAGQVARTLTEDRRTTYVDKNSDIPQPIQRWVQTNVMGKIPGLNNQRPEYIDAWGRKDTTQSFLLRLIDNMISPGYRNEIENTAVDKELQRLADAVGTSVLMSPADRYIEFNNENHNLTAEQYEKYAKVRGNSTFSMLTELFNSDSYASLSDEEKAKAVKALKDYGNVLGKQAVFPEYDPDTDNWAVKCDGDPTRLVNMALLKGAASEQGVTVSNNGKFYNLVINADWLTPTEQAYAMAQQYTTTSKNVYVSRSSHKYDLTPERKEILYKHVRDIYPAYYTELVESKAWKKASDSKRMDLLKGMRDQISQDAKVWLARQLEKAGER